MKIRNGFVSNSSSSSFVVLFSHEPQNEEDLKEMMFKEWRWDEIIETDLDVKPRSITIRQIVSRVFNDIKNGQKDRCNITREDALGGYIEEIDGNFNIVKLSKEAFCRSSDEEYAIYHDLGKKYGYEKKDEKKWGKDKILYPEYLKRKEASGKAEEAWMTERNKAVKEFYDKFRARYKYHKYECILEYGDRYCEYILENESIFRNLPHLIISNH